MQQVEFTVPKTCDLATAVEKIEQVCAAQGLTMSMKTSQAAFPGSTHWHYKNKKLKGTLELTLYIPARRVWANVQSGRKAPWIDALLPVVQLEVESALLPGPWRLAAGP
jgi:hypothetical protein